MDSKKVNIGTFLLTLIMLGSMWWFRLYPDPSKDPAMRGGALMTGWLPIIVVCSALMLSAILQVVAAHGRQKGKRLKGEIAQLQADLAKAKESAKTIDGLESGNRDLRRQKESLESSMEISRREVAEARDEAKVQRDLNSEIWDARVTCEANLAALKLDSNRRVLIAGTLSKCVAMIEEHFTALQQLRQPLVDKGFLEAWINAVEYSIKDLLGPDAVEAFYDGAETGKPPPDTLNEQVSWMRRYTGKLNMIISEQLDETKTRANAV